MVIKLLCDKTLYKSITIIHFEPSYKIFKVYTWAVHKHILQNYKYVKKSNLYATAAIPVFVLALGSSTAFNCEVLSSAIKIYPFYKES